MMKKHYRLKAVILLATCGVPWALQAQEPQTMQYDRKNGGDDFGPRQGDWEMTLGGSGSNDRDFEGGSASVNGSLGFFLTDGWELSIRQGVLFADAGEGSDFWNGTTRGALDYHFDLGRVRPFVGANFGGFYGDTVTDTWAAGLEAGLKFYVKRQTFVFAMGEYQWLFKDSDSAEDSFDDGRFLYSLGIGFNF